MSQNNLSASAWLSPEADKAVRKNILLRRAIEDYYGIKGYTTVNIWLLNKSKKLLNPGIIKIISLHTGIEEDKILSQNENIISKTA